MAAVPRPETPPDPESVETFGYRQELKRSLSFTDLLVYGLIFMVPIARAAVRRGVGPGA